MVSKWLYPIKMAEIFVIYAHKCNALKCPFLLPWKGHSIDVSSCELLGSAHIITQIPRLCPHKKELKIYHVKLKLGYVQTDQTEE